MVSKRMKELGTARSVIRELYEYGRSRAAVVGAENVFDFSLGNPSVPPPAEVNAAAQALLTQRPELIHCYTSAQGDLEARSKLAGSLSRRFGRAYGPDELYLTVGAAAALCCVFHALACPGDRFIAIAPYFPEYRVFVEGAGGALDVVPPKAEDFQIDFAALENLITDRTKGVIVNSPNNPSGVVYSRATLERLSALLTEKSGKYGHPIYLISDEPYREIVYSGVEAPWLPSLYENTIVCYSFSKSLSLPGERIGYVLVPRTVSYAADVYAAVAGAGRSLGYVNAPSLFQQVTAQCCDLTSDISVYEGNRDLLVRELTALGFEMVVPGGAFYLFPKCLEEDDLAFSERAKEFDLLLVPGSGFGAPGYFRLAYCVQPEMIRRALPRFKALAASYQ